MLMTIYVDFPYYAEQFQGTDIAQAEFRALAQRASAVIDQLTFERAGPVMAAGTDTATIGKIKAATCAVAEELHAQDAGGEIREERVGQHQVSYNVGPARSKQAGLARAAKLYLGSTGLMYRGLDEGE